MLVIVLEGTFLKTNQGGLSTKLKTKTVNEKLDVFRINIPFSRVHINTLYFEY